MFEQSEFIVFSETSKINRKQFSRDKILFLVKQKVITEKLKSG